MAGLHAVTLRPSPPVTPKTVRGYGLEKLMVRLIAVSGEATTGGKKTCQKPSKCLTNTTEQELRDRIPRSDAACEGAYEGLLRSKKTAALARVSAAKIKAPARKPCRSLSLARSRGAFSLALRG